MISNNVAGSEEAAPCPAGSRPSCYGVSGLRRIFWGLYDGLVVAALDE